MVETIAICDSFCLWNSSGSGIRCQAYSNIKGITMAVLEPERANQLVKEAGKAFALPAGVMGGIITTENDVIRIFGITLSNWLLIISAIYSLIQIFFFIRRCPILGAAITWDNNIEIKPEEKHSCLSIHFMV